MNDLPIELIGVVVDNITSTSDLLALRSVNATCHRLVTPRVFRRVHVYNSVKSAENCRSILASPLLAPLVREVVYDQRDHARFCLLPAGAQGACDELEIAELEDVLTETFCSLPDFKNLESITLSFWPSFRSHYGSDIHEHPFWFTNRQIVVLHAVHHAMKSSCIRSLTLNNVILMSSACYDFVASVMNSSLQHFSMSVVANSELGAWSGSKALNGSLSSLLPASNPSLKSLILRSPQGLYHSLSTQLRSTHYPALETLVLENIVFDPTPSVEGIEEFILRHKTSLRHLELHGCSSYVPCTTIPVRRWSTVWKRFEELASLTEIVVSDAPQGYSLLDGTRGYVPHPVPPSGLGDEDEDAYSRFRDGVNLRSILGKRCP